MRALVHKHKSDMIIFLSVVSCMIIYNLIHYQSLYIQTPDGTLYLSVAKNFIENGHFIQTARPYETNMIVPPGLPFIFTIILGLTYDHFIIVIMQYILFGASAVLLAKASRFIFKSDFTNFIIPLLFISACFYVKEPNPGELISETYTVFFLSIISYFSLNPDIKIEKKSTIVTVLSFVAYLIRPSVGGMFLVSIIVIGILTIMRKFAWKRLIACALSFITVLGLNTIVNYRETGYVVILENYGSIPFYQANNSETKTYTYSSALMEEFSDQYFIDTYNNENLDMNEKNERLRTRTVEFILNNIAFVAENTKIKYESLFIKPWNWNFYILFASVLYWAIRKRVSWVYALLTLLSFILLTIIPAFGLYIFRYAVPCIPFYLLWNGTLYTWMVDAAFRHISHLTSEKNTTLND